MFQCKTTIMEAPGIDPGTSRMLSERSTIWATPPTLSFVHYSFNIFSSRYELLKELSKTIWDPPVTHSGKSYPLG